MAISWNTAIFIACLLIGGTIFIQGCTQVPTCPTFNCPTVTCPTVTAPVTESVEVHFIDVAQGDAILIKSGETEALIDCGKQSKGALVTDYLKRQGVTTLEYLIMTHPDADHIGGCEEVLNMTVQTVITNGEVGDTLTYGRVMAKVTGQQIIAKQGDKWNIGKAQLNIIHSNVGASDTNINSIVAKLSYGQMDVLLTGDCDKECETMISDNNLDAEILKVAHHGTKFATSIAFLDKVNPEIAVIEVGPNSYGHPAQETLDRLSQEGVITYRTDINNDVVIKLSEGSYEVVT